ncbi:MAG: putative motility protein [Deltaproteobacteria bacterium]|nr:putative motility protein [Deltaproteobacteria bacterium]
MILDSIASSATNQNINVSLIKSSREQEKAVVGTILEGIAQNGEAVAQAVKQNVNPHIGKNIDIIA